MMHQPGRAIPVRFWFTSFSVAAAYLPGRIKTRLKHPMLTAFLGLGTSLANGESRFQSFCSAPSSSGPFSRAWHKRQDVRPPPRMAHPRPAAGFRQ